MQPVNTCLLGTLAGLLWASFFCPSLYPGLAISLFAVCLLVCSRFVSCLFHPALFVLAAALIWSYLAFLPGAQDIADLPGARVDAEVYGEVLDVRQRSGGRFFLDIRTAEVRSAGRVFAGLANKGLRLYIDAGDPASFLPGDKVHFRAHVRLPRAYGTPGEFNWPRYLLGQGITLSSWLPQAEGIELSDRSPAWTAAFARLHNRVRSLLQRQLPEQRGQLVQALVLGDGGVLDDSVRALVKSSGISHLFAISGMHLGVVGWLLFLLLFSLYRRSMLLLQWLPGQRLIPFLLLPLLYAYLLLTGNAIATRRAMWLAVIAAFVLVKKYHVKPLQVLLTLALMSLWLHPYWFWQAGWQLSYAGAGGLLFMAPVLVQRRGYRVVRWVTGLVRASAAAALVTLPLVLYHFHMFTPAVVFANLIAVPVVTMFALPAGLLALLLFPLSAVVATVLFHCSGYSLELLIDLVRWLLTCPGLVGRVSYLSYLQCLGLAVVAALLLCLWRYRWHRKYLPVYLAAAAVAVLLLCPVRHRAILSLTMLSVGQGESMLLQNGAGQAVLIDGGGLYSNTYDVGERLVAPALGELGVHYLDAVVLTHDHPDHRQGLLHILAHFPVGVLLLGKPLELCHASLQEVVRRKDIPWRQIVAGWSVLPWWQGAPLWVYRDAVAGTENDRSLVIFTQGTGRGLLLTGDLEAEGVRRLLGTQLPGPVSLLKLPHHGSRLSATDELVRQLRPQYGLVSCGYANRYSFPAAEVVGSLAGYHTQLYRTDLDGTFRAALEADGWRLERWSYGLFR